jgi:hypothetical protein
MRKSTYRTSALQNPFIRLMGDVEAGALLYDARDMFDKQNAKADEVLRSIVNSLPEAVATCAAAAAAELDPLRQTALLKVRSFVAA